MVRLVALIWLFGGVLLAAVLVVDARRPADRAIIKIAGADSVVYYAVARSILFDHDVDLRNEIEALEPEPGTYLDPVPASGLPAIVYPIGFSLVQIPWLAAGSAIDWARGAPVTGYSITCIRAYYLGILTWLCVGLSALFLWLRGMGAVLGSPQPRLDLLAFGGALAVWPSTTLAYYTFSAMAHVAAFAATACFLLIWWRARDSVSVLSWVAVGAAGGVMVLCRWQEALLLLVPAVWDTGVVIRRHAHVSIGDLAKSRLIAVATFVVVFFPQMSVWHTVYGAWLTIPQGEGFLLFPPPFVLETLFSSQNGWFIWTPITAIGVAGLFAGLRRSPLLFGSLLAALVAELVLVGGVLTWHGHWFGLRYLTSLTPLVAAGLFALATSARRWAGGLIVAAVLLCSVYTLVFAMQFRLDLIPKQSVLTIDELVWDKLHLVRAYRRQQQAAAAARTLDAGDARSAIEIARQAEREFGTGASLLQVRVAACRRLGDVALSEEASRDVQAYQARRLF